MRHVFISYPTKNRNIAKRICAGLEREGWKCWMAPRDVPPGSDWAKMIVAAIKESQFMVAVVSKDACNSKHMARELDRAAANQVPILPVRLDGTPLTEQFEYYLGNTQWLDARGRPFNDFEEDLVNAARALQGRSGGPAETSDPAVHPAPGESPGVIQTFVAGALKQDKALADVNLTDSRTFRFALTILIGVSLATAALHIPAWREQGIRYDNLAFIPLATAEDLIDQIAFCFLMYLAVRIFGGTVDARQFFTGFGLLGAYLLMSNISLAPVWVRTVAGNQRATGDPPIADLAVIAAGSAAWLTFRIVFARSLFRAFHITEQLGTVRAAMSFLIGIGMWFLSVLLFSRPFLESLYKAFGAS